MGEQPGTATSASRRRFIGSVIASGAVLGSRAAAAALPDIGSGVTNRSLVHAQRHPTQSQLIERPSRWEPGDFVQKVLVDDRRLALTLDDGPSPWNTHRILRELAARQVKATFFMVGTNVRAWPDIARDVVSEGHEIGNHSVFHTPYRSSSLAAQIGPNQDIIEEETGVRPVANRAPGLTRGSSILSVCRSEGMYEVHTNMSSGDYLTPRWSASRLIGQFSHQLRTGAFPIYHDGGGRRPTRDAVGPMLDIALARNYTLLRATELVESGEPYPGRQSYAALRRALSDDGTDDGLPLVDCCRFDVRAAFLERLDEPTVSARERSRIVEQLAALDDHHREHN